MTSEPLNQALIVLYNTYSITLPFALPLSLQKLKEQTVYFEDGVSKIGTYM